MATDLPYDHWDKCVSRPVELNLFPPRTFGRSSSSTGAPRKSSSRSRMSRNPFKGVPTGDFQRALHEIDSHARGRSAFPEGVVSSEGRDVYLQKSLIEEPFSSSALEGAATTREIARKMIRRSKTPQDARRADGLEQLRSDELRSRAPQRASVAGPHLRNPSHTDQGHPEASGDGRCRAIRDRRRARRGREYGRDPAYPAAGK